MANARVGEGLSRLSNPFVRDPLGAEDDGAASVQHVHVRATAAPNIKPEHSRAFDRLDGHAQPREGCEPTERYLYRDNNV